MAGNIIPAIATTNAITAGIVVMRAFNVLQEEYDKCQSVYVRLRLNPRNQIFVPDRSKFEFRIECCINRDSSAFLSPPHSVDATESKMHRLFSEARGVDHDRHEKGDCQTIPR